MKKLFYLLAIATALVIGATACTPEEPNHEPAAASMELEYMEYSDFCLR